MAHLSMMLHVSVHRHDTAEVAGLSSYAFGEDGVNRYIMLCKKVHSDCSRCAINEAAKFVTLIMLNF